jgi:2-polyprenyl-3-methyl-5-hydroxy-6-metoxy-1,4-benzoquinol methylase
MILFINNKPIGEISFAGKNLPDRLLNFNALDDEANAFYSDFYSSDENPLKRTREIQFKEISSRLNSHLMNLETRLSLDVGCGDGLFVSFLKRQVPSFRCYGIEPSLPAETESLKKMPLDKVGGNSRIPTKYSVISLLDVLEHFPDPKECLCNLDGLLTQDGILVIKVPNKKSTLYRLAKMLRFFMPEVSNKIFVRLYQVKYPPRTFSTST